MMRPGRAIWPGGGIKNESQSLLDSPPSGRGTLAAVDNRASLGKLKPVSVRVFRQII